MSNIMKRLKTYITEAQTEYPFRLKFAVDLTDEHLDTLESCLQRYGVKSVSKATKTIMQKHPMDFGNLPAGEIHIVDIVLEYPTTPDTLTSYLHNKLGVPQSHIVVRSPNHPEEVQNDADQKAADDKDPDAKPESLLDSDYEDSDGDPVAGQEHTDAMLDAEDKKRKGRLFDMINFEKDPSSEVEHEPDELLKAPQGTKSPVGSN